jgi:hypothetical protein
MLHLLSFPVASVRRMRHRFVTEKQHNNMYYFKDTLSMAISHIESPILYDENCAAGKRAGPGTMHCSQTRPLVFFRLMPAP